jgi:hypothetical protein
MLFLRKLKEVLVSVLPIVAIVLVLNFTVCKFETKTLINFVISACLLCVGEVLFLTGVDSTIMPMGQMVGASVSKISNFCLFLFFAFLFGMFATVAEPDVQVLCGEIVSIGALNISSTLLVFIIGAGIGIFVVLALARIVKRISIKLVYMLCLAIVFILASMVPESFVAIAFDAGGSTVGIVTTPFMLAMVEGIVNKSSKKSADKFGVIGIASLGPVIALLVLSLFLSGGSASTVVESESYNIFVDVIYNTLLAIVPLAGVFYIFELIFIKLPRKKIFAMIVGLLLTTVGLYMFLFAIDYGFIPLGKQMGEKLSSTNIYIIMIVFILFGFCIVFTEPAVRVLGAQVEAETQGNINRKLVNISIAIAMMLAVALSAARVYFNLSIWYFIGIGYGLIAILMFFSSPIFVSIAFDSGGVASGPISTALLMPAMVALSSTGADGFGFIAMVGMMPILVMEFMGVLYNIKLARIKKQSYKVALRIAYGAGKYSNMDNLEARYRQLKEAKDVQE